MCINGTEIVKNMLHGAICSTSFNLHYIIILWYVQIYARHINMNIRLYKDALK